MLLPNFRQTYLKVIEGLSKEQLLLIPEGFNNNILWNLGHVVVTQQMLTYGLAGKPLYVSDDLVKLYRKGTSPKTWTSEPDSDLIKTLLVELPETFLEDYKTDMFQTFQEYKSATTGAVLRTIEDGIAFNDFHEGLHLGSILALRKRV